MEIHEWKLGGATHVGHVRARNEDAYALDEALGLLILADGMGGHPAADLAARLAVDAALRHIRERAGAPDTKAVLSDAIVEANRVVHAHSLEHPDTTRMGTTLVVARVVNDVLFAAHAGDSRLYVVSGGEIVYATKDHSLVGELLERGEITPEEAAVHPLRNMITRSVGTGPAVSPETHRLSLTRSSRVILFSDGLNKMLDDSRIAELLAQGDNPVDISRRLVEAANDAGGIDNTTVAVALAR